jgi:erythronate-4-phosphate dehydrogenase
VLRERFGFELRNTTLGVVGVGNVGGKVVRKASALGMRILQNDPPLQRAGCGSHFAPLDDLMKADIITLHVPLTYDGIDAPYHLFNEKCIAAMKRGSILINSSRGPVVSTDALGNALKERHLRSAVIDVWEKEPEINKDILKMISIGTPHIAGYSIEGKTNGAISVYEEVCNFLHAKHNWSIDDKLPSPKVSDIIVSDQRDDRIDAIREVVKKCYDIEGDDRNLREVLNFSEEERKKYFVKLRAEYPVRREFYATDVKIPEAQAELLQCLKSIGFTVNGNSIM